MMSRNRAAAHGALRRAAGRSRRAARTRAERRSRSTSARRARAAEAAVATRARRAGGRARWPGCRVRSRPRRGRRRARWGAASPRRSRGHSPARAGRARRAKQQGPTRLKPHDLDPAASGARHTGAAPRSPNAATRRTRGRAWRSSAGPGAAHRRGTGRATGSGACSVFPLPLAAEAYEMFMQAPAAGHGAEDDSAVIKILPGISLPKGQWLRSGPWIEPPRFSRRRRPRGGRDAAAAAPAQSGARHGGHYRSCGARSGGTRSRSARFLRRAPRPSPITGCLRHNEGRCRRRYSPGSRSSAWST